MGTVTGQNGSGETHGYDEMKRERMALISTESGKKLGGRKSQRDGKRRNHDGWIQL